MSKQPSKAADFMQRFIFEAFDIRGEYIAFDDGFAQALDNHAYPEPVAVLLGEFLLASALLSTSIKFEGRLVLQIRAEGPVTLMMAESTHTQQLRGIARYDSKAFTCVDGSCGFDFKQLFATATLAITIEPEKGERYQGIVPLAGDSLADSLTYYFEQSEQLASQFSFAVDVDQRRARGFMLQQLPVTAQQRVADVDVRQQQWGYAMQMLQTLTAQELLELSPMTLLKRLYVEDDIRLFDENPVAWQCSCSRQRYLEALETLEPAEIDSVLLEQGKLTVTCEFCFSRYDYTADDFNR